MEKKAAIVEGPTTIEDLVKMKEVLDLGTETVEETPVDETPVDETPVDETPVDEGPKTFNITLQGPKNQSLDYGVNGVFAKLPCGVELTVSESVYNAVKAHIISERM